MAHNARIRSDAPWTTVILGSDLQKLDTYAFESVNGDQGGTWAPAAAIIIGGSGLEITGPITMDDIGDSHVTAGNTLTIDDTGQIVIADGGVVVVHDGGAQTFDSGSELNIYGSADIEDSAELNIKNAGYINVESGGVIDVLSGGNVNLQSGSQLRAYSGSYVQIDGDWEATSGATVTIADGATFTVEGTSNYVNLESRSEWIPCGGNYSFSTASQWDDYDGQGFKTNVSSAAKAYCRAAVNEAFTISKVQVRWDGPAHGTWPPQNLTTFSVYQVDVSGAKNLLASQGDTSDQVDYEANHALTIDGFSETFTPGEYLLVEMLTESGTNAVSGSMWVSTQMYATFDEMRPR